MMRRGAIAVLLVAAVALGCGGSKGKKNVELEPGEPALNPAVETYRQGVELLLRHQLRQARERLGDIEYAPSSPVRAELEPLARVALADATFYDNTPLSYIDARSLYRDFVTFFGDHELAPYAQTQIGLCSLRQVSHPTKDQNQTRRAIADFEEVERRWPASPFARAAAGLRRVARSNLAEAELITARFYLKRKAYRAAISRLKTILRDYPDYLDLDRVRFHLGRALLIGGDPAEGRLLLERLAETGAVPFAGRAERLLDQEGGSG